VLTGTAAIRRDIDQHGMMTVRLAYLGVTNAFALLRLLP
jgi:hypothetical protein